MLYYNPATSRNEALPVLVLYYNQAQSSLQSSHEALPVLMLYYNQAQSSLRPKRGTSSTNAVLQHSTIQAGA